MARPRSAHFAWLNNQFLPDQVEFLKGEKYFAMVLLTLAAEG